MADDVPERHAILRRIAITLFLAVARCRPRSLADAEDLRPEAALLFRLLGRGRNLSTRPRGPAGWPPASADRPVSCRRSRRRLVVRCSRRRRRRFSSGCRASDAARSSRSARCRARSTRCRPSSGVRAGRSRRPPRRPGSLRSRACPTAGRRCAVVMPAGGMSHSGLSPRVAAFMNRAHIGTATSAAKPFGRIVCG